jgi:hypothetical protein
MENARIFSAFHLRRDLLYKRDITIRRKDYGHLPASNRRYIGNIVDNIDNALLFVQRP